MEDQLLARVSQISRAVRQRVSAEYQLLNRAQSTLDNFIAENSEAHMSDCDKLSPGGRCERESVDVVSVVVVWGNTNSRQE